MRVEYHIVTEGRDGIVFNRTSVIKATFEMASCLPTWVARDFTDDYATMTVAFHARSPENLRQVINELRDAADKVELALRQCEPQMWQAEEE